MGPLFTETWVGGYFKGNEKKHLFKYMAALIFCQVRADCALHYDKKVHAWEKKIKQNTISVEFEIITLYMIILNLP